MTGRRHAAASIDSVAQLLRVLTALAAIVAAPISSAGDRADGFVTDEAISPVVPPRPLHAGKVSLGRQLFHDPILSRKGMLSCSSCHDLRTGGTVPVSRTVGYEGRVHTFNAPTIFNVGNNHRLGWRGTTTSLAKQNLKVLLDPNLMGSQWDLLLPRLNANEMYRRQFTALYGGVADADTVLDALVTFQKSLVTPDAPFDRYLKGNEGAISTQQKLGYRLFRDHGCISCHQGSNVGGNMLQIFGVFGDPESGEAMDESGVVARLDDNDRRPNLFRVPSLRNVALTAPYFHDGRTETLREAISIMATSQLGRTLPDSDIEAIEAFLKSLTGTYDGKALSSAAEARR